MSVRRITMISMMVCIIAACSWLTIPSVLPFTLQTFAVFCALILLGGKDGLIAIIVYILLGALGIPIYSGFQCGFGHILGSTGGFIVGFILIGICYWIFESLIKRKYFWAAISLSIGLFLCYVIGIIWFYIAMGINGSEFTLLSIFTTCVFPYIIPDLLKLILALSVCKHLKKIINFRKEKKSGNHQY